MKRKKSDKCELPFCDGVSYAMGFCNRHYANMVRFGTPIAPSDLDAVGLITMINDLIMDIYDSWESNDPGLLHTRMKVRGVFDVKDIYEKYIPFNELLIAEKKEKREIVIT